MKISVSLCTYNGERFIHQQLDSIINQSSNVDEIIICDDYSTDNTIKILESFANKYPKLIRVFINNERLGTLKNFEKNISYTNGDLIFLSDQDDIWVKDKVKKTIDFFKKESACKLLFSNGTLIDEDGKSLDSSLWEKWGFDNNIQNKWRNNQKALEDLIDNRNKITGATICFHKSLKRNISPILIPLGYWHDAWFGIHAAAQNGLCFFNENLINYRVHGKQQVGLSSNINTTILQNSNPEAIEKSVFINNLASNYPKLGLNINDNDKKKLLFKRLKFKLSTLIEQVKKYIRNQIKTIYENRIGSFYFKHQGFCPCCEQEVNFIAKHHWLRDHFKCTNCGSIPRERALMLIIEKHYPNWKELKIHESSPGNRGHSTLLKKQCSNYVETHFFEKLLLGEMINGFRNEDLENQTFKDEEFDLVITSDVMEHIYHPEKAFKEIHRTLKKGGAHIFSVPLINKHKKTEVWATKGDNGKPIFLKEPEWHGNPIDKKGSPVTMHWGYDIVDYIKEFTSADCTIEHIDDLNYGIRAEYIEIIVAKKND